MIRRVSPTHQRCRSGRCEDYHQPRTRDEKQSVSELQCPGAPVHGATQVADGREREPPSCVTLKEMQDDGKCREGGQP